MDLRVPVSGDTGLHVRHWQGAVSPAFLLVHGLDSNARLWTPVAKRLSAAGHPVYAVDMRGHGDSDVPETGYDNATAAADLAAVLAAVGVTGAVVAGHSWGAHVALRLAAGRPDLVAALALVEGGWVGPAEIHGVWEQFSAVLDSSFSLAGRALGGATLDGMRTYLRTLHPDWPEESIEASLSSLRVGPDGSLTPRLSRAQRTALMRSLWDDTPDRWFPAVTMPLMLLAAFPPDNERWPPSIRTVVERNRASVSTARKALPHAQVREYVDSDHDLHAQRPEEVAEDLLRLARGLG
ncbi:alpha/beta fold hydrolase [Streptomyces sparsogenes]|uniref:alpha/beta fold hydrolase n=1 Tax=Streptomyces sparsogenes TaxID=67365 RepID=UPI0033CD8FD5